MNSPEYSFVIPVHNEVETLPELTRRIDAVMGELDGSAEVILVDDGSTDGSFELMKRQHDLDPRFRVLRLSRNFGHQIAITAGLDHAAGDAIIIMDADLQDPPEVALELASRWRAGYSVVYAVRGNREHDGIIKRLSAKTFYRLLKRLTKIPIPLDAGDFRLVDRQALIAIRSMREHNRYLRGMFTWVGFDQTGVHYVRQPRFAGKTKFSMRKMVGFATDGVLSFSAVPLRAALNLGFFISSIALAAGIVAIACKIFGVYTTPGWASLTLTIALLGGVQLIVLGVIGEYIARIYEEVRQRPLYLVRGALGLEAGTTDRPGEGAGGPPRG